ncbi:MAG: Type 1 glutamine amidotransferase-like domain-containing protein [Prevotella sp.]|nr:Type 1 glutamine amidotransferase-like domain-containing protein [Prevotella sp.]
MFFITSKFKHYEKDEHGVRVPCVIPDENGILTLLRKHLKRRECLLVIANDPNDSVLNDAVADVLDKAFQMTGISFRQVKILDIRSVGQAASLIQNADLIFLCGGEVLRQLKFLQQIDFKTLIQNYNGIVITVSAASMCLTSTICNFPESASELNQPRFVQGLGMVDLHMIPHFDGETLTYQGTTDLPNLVQDYLLPYSDHAHVCGLPNGSFIVFDGMTLQYWGKHYEIYQRKILPHE